MDLQAGARIGPIKVGMLLLEMQQTPQFEARVRDGQMNLVRLSLIHGLRYVRMNVHVEYAPNFVIHAALIADPSGFGRSLPFAGDGFSDQ
jgi:hypothetical protein